MAKKVTSKRAASAASKVLRDGRTSKASKTAAGSALSQRESKRKNKSRPKPFLVIKFLLHVEIGLSGVGLFIRLLHYSVYKQSWYKYYLPCAI